VASAFGHFSGNIDAFRGTETSLELLSYAVGARGARERRYVSRGTLGTQIKARPCRAEYLGGRPVRGGWMYQSRKDTDAAADLSYGRVSEIESHEVPVIPLG